MKNFIEVDSAIFKHRKKIKHMIGYYLTLHVLANDEGVIEGYADNMVDAVKPRTASKYRRQLEKDGYLVYESGELSILPLDPDGKQKPPGAKDKSGIVYLLNMGGLYKIGITSRSTKKRNKEIARSLLKQIEVIAEIDSSDARETEKMLHEFFSDRRVQGEWFNLSPANVREILNAFEPETAGEDE